MNDFPTVVTERLLLRNFSETDANAVYEIFSNESVTEFYDLEAFTHRRIQVRSATLNN